MPKPRLERKHLLALGVVVSAVFGGYSIGHATSPYPAGAPAPAIFSGSLSSNGVPLEGAHSVGINLWRAADTATATNRVCEGSPQNVTTTAGVFRVSLDATCLDALTRYTQIWYELVVDGQRFPLQQIGAVPFAARSMQEAASGARLKIGRTTAYGEDGYRGESRIGSIRDTQLSTTCSVTTINGSGDKYCLPDNAAGSYPNQTNYSDSACTNAVDGAGVDGASYVFEYSGTPYDSAGDYPLTAVYAATKVGSQAYYRIGAGPCQSNYPLAAYNKVGAAIPFSTFVRISTVTE